MGTNIRSTCCDCEYEFPDPSIREPCPRCGATRRKVLVSIEETLSLRGGLVAKQSRPGWPRFLRKLISRRKLSRGGREAHEVLDIDRTDPQTTVKRHHVEELVDGTWQVVHDETECRPAQRRPPVV